MVIKLSNEEVMAAIKVYLKNKNIDFDSALITLTGLNGATIVLIKNGQKL